MVFQLQCIRIIWEPCELAEPQPQASGGLGWDQRTYTSSHFPGGANAVGAGTSLWEPQVCGQAVGWRGERGLGGILEAGRGGSGNPLNGEALILTKMGAEKAFLFCLWYGGEDDWTWKTRLICWEDLGEGNKAAAGNTSLAIWKKWGKFWDKSGPQI